MTTTQRIGLIDVLLGDDGASMRLRATDQLVKAAVKAKSLDEALARLNELNSYYVASRSEREGFDPKMLSLSNDANGVLNRYRKFLASLPEPD